MIAHGIPGDRIIQVSNPYYAKEVLFDYDPSEVEAIYLVGEKDMAEDPRFKKTEGTTKDGYKWSIEVAPHVAKDVEGEEMSGTSLRNTLAKANEETFYSIMGFEDKKIYDLLTQKLSQIEEDYYSPDEHYRDFAKSSEWKAGYRGKKDIPRKGDQIHNRQKSPVSWEEGLIKETRGGESEIHIYDFDETIARVETPIPYSILAPDGTEIEKGETTSVEFEEKQKEIENDYDKGVTIEYNFDAFEKQIGDAIINEPVYEKLKNSLSNPNVKTTVLTARSIGHPVTRYLKDIGLEVYVVPLGLQIGGKVTGQDKANWIDKRIKKTTKKVYFIDDSEDNREAVTLLKDKHPNIVFDIEDPPKIEEMMAGTMNKREKRKHKRTLKRIKKGLKKFQKKNRYFKVPKSWRGSLTRKMRKENHDPYNHDEIGHYTTSTALINDLTIPLEVMKTPEEQTTGMMDREEMKAGMLFPYDEVSRKDFHMEGCLIPLDIIFINKGKIDTIHSNCPPCKELPCKKYSGLADNVLELPGGYCKKNNINAGDKFNLNLTENFPPYKAIQVQQTRYKASDVFTRDIKKAEKMGYKENVFTKETSNKIFVMKSPETPIGQKWDHIGFILDNGMLRDMSGHRGSDKTPETYKWEDTEEIFKMPKDKEEAIKKKLYAEKELPKEVIVPNKIVCDIKDPDKKAENCGSFVKIVLSNNGIETTESNWMGDIFNSIPKENIEENVFTKEWWKDIINKMLLTEGGAPGHMAHPFDLDNVNSGKDLIEIMKKSFKSLQENPGSVKIDGTNTSVRLIDVDGEKQFAMDRGSKKDIDVKGITKDDLATRFKTKDGSPHGMVAAGGKVLDLFNGALPYIEDDLKKIGSWDNSDILFNTEYVEGTTNVQEYDESFLAIHNVKEMKMVEEPSEKTGKPLIKRKAIDVDVDSSTFQSLIDNFNEYAQTQDFKIYGQVATEVIKEPDFNSALSKTYTIKTNEGDLKKSLKTLLDELDAIPKKDFIFMNVNNTPKEVGSVSKMVYTTILDGGNIDDLFESEEDKNLAIKGFTTYLATEMLGQEILKILDSPMGTVDTHEGVVINDKKIANKTFKLSGAFIRRGMVSDFN
jgi:uncharacterized membrane protein (UPF0127 family)